FYFYHILSRKKNARSLYWGNLAHHSRVFELVLNFLDIIRETRHADTREKLTAFALGYISHCAIDIITHPYIFYISGDYYSENPDQATKAQENHLRVEYILDSHLVYHRWGMTPREYNFKQYIAGTDETDDAVGRGIDRDIWHLWVRALERTHASEFKHFYVGSPHRIEKGDIINESYLGFVRFASLTDVRSRTVRAFLKSLDTLTFRRLKTRYLILPAPDTIDRRLTNAEHREWKYPADPARRSTVDFVELVNQAARFSTRLISDSVAYLEKRMTRKDYEKEYLNYNLDTGIRSASLQMTEFAPIHEDPEPD
ncbi:MAG: zinc dependent phospholipase C family protein, partial [Leptospiraceae bacterium]|nr:zinc dependent phospholipase C family protein [Leptospiraceae bacterium]